MNQKIKYFIGMMLLSTGMYCQRSVVNTANTSLLFYKESVFINFDIINSTSNELYSVFPIVYKKDGTRMNAVSFTGDLFETKGGNNKLIVWDSRKDIGAINEEIYVTLNITTKVNIPVSSHLLKSLAFPGWGDYRIRKNKYHFIYGIAGYGAIGASVYLNSQAAINYEKYKNSFEFNESNSLFNKAKQQQNLSRLFAGVACVVWTADLACLYKKLRKTKNNITPENSKYYYEKSQQKNTFTSKTQLLDTRLVYDIAMEDGDDFFAQEKYNEAKLRYENALILKSNDDEATKKIVITKTRIEEENNKALAYAEAMKKAEDLLKEKKYQEAKTFFESAKTIRPKEKEPEEKIAFCNSEIDKIKRQALYDEQMKQGNKLLANNNFEEAETVFNYALSYLPNDIDAINKIKECENGIALKEQKQRDQNYKHLIDEGNKSYYGNKFEEATALFNQALSNKPNDDVAKNNIKMCENAIAKIEQERSEKEYQHFISLGDVAYTKKLYDDAKAYYQQAINIFPGQTYPINKITSIDKLNEVENLDTKQDITKIYDRCKNAVFYIVEMGVDYNDEIKIKSQGSGFFISADGIGMSCQHVLNRTNYKNSVVWVEKDNYFDVDEILKEDKNLDYVIFRVKKNERTISSLTISSKEPETTNEVFAIGNPEGLSKRYTHGTVNGFEDDKNEIAIDVGITHVSSGGPLFNMKGEVIGITSGGHNYEGGNFNVAVNIQKTLFRYYIK